MIKAFRESYQELKKLKTIVITALLIAVGIILGQFSVQLTETTKIGISFIATQMTANLFGPVVGGIMGGVTDILKFIIKQNGSTLDKGVFGSAIRNNMNFVKLHRTKMLCKPRQFGGGYGKVIGFVTLFGEPRDNGNAVAHFLEIV